MLANAVHLMLKAANRLTAYIRGAALRCSIELCGGQCDGALRVGTGMVFKYPPHSGIRFGRNISIGPGCVIDVPKGAVLDIGDNVTLTGYIFIAAFRHIEIGADSLIAERVSIRDSEHMITGRGPIRAQDLKHGDVVIGPDVWIGCGTLILLSTSLGRGTVIGANSLAKSLTTDPYSVHAGNPIRKLRDRSE